MKHVDFQKYNATERKPVHAKEAYVLKKVSIWRKQTSEKRKNFT
jgi:hypothetical protein